MVVLVSVRLTAVTGGRLLQYIILPYTAPVFTILRLPVSFV
jgi:hypothetical protein